MRPVVTVRADTGEVHRSTLLRETPCGKRGYTARKRAAEAAARQRKATGEPIAAYRCVRGCRCWHIGHPPGWREAQAS